MHDIEHDNRRYRNAVAAALTVTVITQIVYMVTLGGPSPADPEAGVKHADIIAYFGGRWPEIAAVWMTELACFCVITVAALVTLARSASPLSWGALALAGLLDIVQISFGLALFRPFATADAQFAPLLGAIVAGAFFFYFLAKALIGLAGVGFGLALLKQKGKLAKAIGALGIAIGGIAAAINILALPQGMAWTQYAGASGTVAALVLAIMLLAGAGKVPDDS